MRFALFARGVALCVVLASALSLSAQERSGDYLRDVQNSAAARNASPVAHWGYDKTRYTLWGTHSNRLIPVYTFGTRDAGEGIDLQHYTGANSAYRSQQKLREIYGYLPEATVTPQADYLDQTDLFRMQQAALASKKHIILMVFDGMDWDTTRAAAIQAAQAVKYSSGRGVGLRFQDYTAGDTSQFGYMATSPHNDGTRVNINTQTVLNPGGTLRGGYNIEKGGANPWTPGNDPLYIVSLPKDAPLRHAYTDSSSSAVSMTAGIKTYNNAVNVDAQGVPVETIAQIAQRGGRSVGVVSSVPISHATPAAAYAANVHRDDFQDLSRDLLGLPSISRAKPLTGMDVVIGGGYGVKSRGKFIETSDGPADLTDSTKGQGANFVPGNIFLTDADLAQVDARNGGPYQVAIRTQHESGRKVLLQAAREAIEQKRRLLGFFGVGRYNGHLAFATANGDFRPAMGRTKQAELYEPGDLTENPTLAVMTQAALEVLATNPKGFWLMVEAGDVDWANHDDNLDNSIGAVKSGDAAFQTIVNWVEQHSSWKDTLLIVTADHGHYLVLNRPELIVTPAGYQAD
jgi:alkaline phosphatase